jgi:hypothetical protein
MGKRKTNKAEANTMTAILTKQEVKKRLDAVRSNYSITDATIKDGFCNYTYEIIHGVGALDSHKVGGKNLFRDDLQNAFNKLRVHLAVVDNAFQLSKIDIEDIDQFHMDNITLGYEVSGIKIKGLGDNEAVIITGNKYLGPLGRMDLESPRISMEELSGYKWHNELRDAVALIREEVSLYKEGYYTPTEIEEPEDDENQLTLELRAGGKELLKEDHEEFEGAKV